MNKILHLANKISIASTNYYLGSPIMSDEEFDKLVEELRQLDPNHKILNSVGWGLDLDKSSLTKVAHPYSKLEGLPTKFKVQGDTLVNSVGVVRLNTPKLDGLSVEVCYVDGLLSKAITRGNGVVGLDVTSKIRYVVPLALPECIDLSVRGEFVLSYDKFNEFYSDSPSPRNVAAGLLNRQNVDRNEINRFSFVAYKIIACSKQLDSNVSSVRKSAIQFLSDIGFEVVPYILTNTPMTYEETYKILNESMDQNYPLDGIVSSNPAESIKLLNKDIYVIEYKDELAYKTITKTAITTVTEVSWNLTRTGKLIPTILYEPVELSGATLTRALGHNAKYIADNLINIGAKVEIVRSGEVIPYILGVEEPSPAGVELPNICPCCGGCTEWKGVDLICTNLSCISKELANVYHWINRTSGLDGLGSSLISIVIDTLNITKVEDLYTVDEDTINSLINVEGIGSSKLQLIKDLFKELNKPKDARNFLVGLNLDGLGWRSSNKLLEDDTLVKLLQNKQRIQITNYLLNTNHKGVMRKSKEAIINNLDRIFRLLDFVLIYYSGDNEIPPSIESNKLIPICVTGKLENFSTRKDLFTKLADKVVEADIKRCKYLVCNNDKGSSKSKYANANNIPVISEAELLDMIKIAEVNS